MFWILIALGSVLEVIGDYYFKADTFVRGLIFYGLGSVAWAFSLRYEDLAVAVTLFTLINLLLGIAVGHYAFQETLKLHQCFGILFSCLGILLLCV